MKKSVALFGFLVLIVVFSNSVKSDTIPTSTQQDSIIASTDTSAVAATEEPVYPLSQERKAKLIAYSKFNNLWRFADFFIGFGLTYLILFTGLSAKLRNFANRGRYKFFIWWLYLILFSAVYYIISFPFDYYRDFVVESNFGFMNQTLGEWFIDTLKSLGLAAFLGILPLWLLYFIIERSKKWWLWFGLGTIPILILLVVIAPVFITPMYNEFTPLKNKELETKILNLASKAGIEGSKVFEVDASKQSSKVNAYVTGLFNTKRIVLYDTIIKGFTDDEILFVMGHEMGHYVMHHIWKGLTLAVVMVMLFFWLTSVYIERFINRFKSKLKFETLADIASLPLVLLFINVIGFVAQPIENTFSRHLEHQADIYGMDISQVDGESAAIAFDKLAAFNLSDPEPNPIIEFWFYSHPSLAKRMEFVRNYKQ